MMIILSPSFAWVNDAQSFKSDLAGSSQTVRCSCTVTRINSPFLTCSLPGVKKPLSQYGPAGVEDSTAAAPAAADEDDDDIDLFGSDEEEVSSVAEGMVCFDRIAWSNDDFLTIFRLMLWLTTFSSWKPVSKKWPCSFCMFDHGRNHGSFFTGWGNQKDQGGEACSIQRKEGKEYVLIVS